MCTREEGKEREREREAKTREERIVGVLAMREDKRGV